ncbi:hypothetical protein X736_29650 [Mesorhizobium sp. L2C089B000]|nr:hypothetical protein X736_29650 [Mesorhizobium sp. L2C089B000]
MQEPDAAKSRAGKGAAGKPAFVPGGANDAHVGHQAAPRRFAGMAVARDYDCQSQKAGT